MKLVIKIKFDTKSTKSDEPALTAFLESLATLASFASTGRYRPPVPSLRALQERS